MVTVSGGRMAQRAIPFVGPERMVRAASAWASSARRGIPSELAAVFGSVKAWLDPAGGAALVFRAYTIFRGSCLLCSGARSWALARRVGSCRMRLRARRLRRNLDRSTDGEWSGLDASGLSLSPPRREG